MFYSLFDFGDLLKPDGMASAGEWGGEPDPQDVFGEAPGQQPATERKYIGIIMFPAISG
jgi:hypothetical protein